MADELVEINGIKPNVVFGDGEEREVGSSSSKAVYKVKRTADHFHCTCPAWRNQKGQPVNARSCKHLKALLGEEYEAARVELKNPGGSSAGKGRQAKAKGKAVPASKAAASAKPKDKAPVKRKKVEDDEDEEKGEDEEEAKSKPPPSKRGRNAPASRSSNRKTSSNVKKEQEDEDAMDVDDVPAGEKSSGDDELAEIYGVKPKVLIADEEVREVKSATSKSVYKVKRSFDHFHCSCPAWRNQSVPVNARSCKHLQSLLGAEYETARLKFKTSGSSSGGGGAVTSDPSKKPGFKKAAAKRKKADEDEDQGGGDEGDEKKPVKKPRRAHGEDQEQDEQEPTGTDGDASGTPGEAGDQGVADGDGADADADELAVINGVKPKVYLQDGEETEVKSASSNSMYKVKRTWDHYYCACPAWRNQKGPVNARTCKHLQSLLGHDYEAARLKFKNPDGPPPKGTKASASRTSKAKGKKKADGGDGEEEDGGDEDDDEDGDEARRAKGVPALLLANKWDIESGVDPTGWWISEKLDGVRTFFDGKQFISRLGNPFAPPKWFIEALPKNVTLDGELFGGRQQFQSTVSVVKTVNSPHWKTITFQVFDIPSRGSEPFEKRIEAIHELFGKDGSHACAHVSIVEHVQAKDRDHVLERLKEVEELGGEGLMLRKPESQYEGSRSSTLLKVKTFYDAEAIVTGYVPGKGRNAGVTGALKCKMASGKTFNVGTGLSDKQRKNPPKVGSIIVYRFQELTRDRVPRFPSFVGEAADKTQPKDADIPVTRIPGVKPADA